MSRRRALLTAASGGGWKKTPHDLADYQGPGFVVSQSSDIDDERLAWRAMDGDLRAEGHESHTSNDGIAWWRIDFKSRTVLKQLVWQWRKKEDGSVNDESGWSDAIKVVILQGSDDGETWTDVREIVHPGVGDITVELGETPPFRCWRLLAQDYGYLIIGELEFTYREGNAASRQ